MLESLNCGDQRSSCVFPSWYWIFRCDVMYLIISPKLRKVFGEVIMGIHSVVKVVGTSLSLSSRRVKRCVLLRKSRSMVNHWKVKERVTILRANIVSRLQSHCRMKRKNNSTTTYRKPSSENSAKYGRTNISNDWCQWWLDSLYSNPTKSFKACTLWPGNLGHAIYSHSRLFCCFQSANKELLSKSK